MFKNNLIFGIFSKLTKGLLKLTPANKKYRKIIIKQMLLLFSLFLVSNVTPETNFRGTEKIKRNQKTSHSIITQVNFGVSNFFIFRQILVNIKINNLAASMLDMD